jgi:hypothetical protein
LRTKLSQLSPYRFYFCLVFLMNHPTCASKLSAEAFEACHLVSALLPPCRLRDNSLERDS